MTTKRTTAHLFPSLHEAPPAPDLTGAPCIDRPQDWDVDALGHDHAAIEVARRRCRYDCPVLLACHRWTVQLAKSASTRPSGVVQGGVVYAQGNRKPRGKGKAA